MAYTALATKVKENNIEVFNNPELGFSARTMLNEDGSISINAEDTARGFGWTQEKNGKTYVRWETMNGYCIEFGFSQLVGKDDYIPEPIFYRLGMKASNKTADKFQNWLAMEVIPSIRKHGMYATDNVIDNILSNPDFGIKILTELKEERIARIAAEEEKEKLQQELDYSKDWYSIKRVAAMNGVDWKTFNWRKLKEKSIELGYGVKKIFDANYGEVNTYHRDAWEVTYPEYEI